MDKALKIILLILLHSHFSQALSSYENDLFKSVNSILDEEVIFSGPNCHNTTLRALKLTNYKRYIHEPEMKDFLINNCIETTNNKKSIDDVNVIYAKDLDTPFHSFVDLGNDLVFTKNGVSKRALPEVQNFNEMLSLHKSAIKVFCKVNKIKNCVVEVRSFNCFNQQPYLKGLEHFINKITLKRDDFFQEKNQKEVLKILSNIDFRTYCSSKKLSLQSIILTIKLANMSSLGPEERFKTEAFEDQVRKIYESVDCLKDIPLTS